VVSDFGDLSDAELIAAFKAEMADFERLQPEIRKIKPSKRPC
jgi:hypothetical protein